MIFQVKVIEEETKQNVDALSGQRFLVLLYLYGLLRAGLKYSGYCIHKLYNLRKL